MPGLVLKIALRLLATEQGGRKGLILSDYRPDWDIGNETLDGPTVNGARVALDGQRQLLPGEECVAQLIPLVPDLWGRIRVGMSFPAHEGAKIVGYARVLEIVALPEHWSPDVAMFVQYAGMYCDFIKTAHEFPLAERLARSRRCLLWLYEAALKLPHVDASDEHDAGPSSEPPTGWVGFEDFEIYWVVFSPYVDEPAVAGSLSDDLLDIYRDVSRGLALWNGASKLGAIWEWRFHFDFHWGTHAADALRALHWACAAATSQPH